MHNSNPKKLTYTRMMESRAFKAGVADKRTGVWNADRWAGTYYYNFCCANIYENGRQLAAVHDGPLIVGGAVSMAAMRVYHHTVRF